MRTFLIVLVLIVAGVIGALLWLLRDPNAFKPELESLIADNAGLKVRFTGDLSWRLWPPVQLVAHDVSADWNDPGREPLLFASVVRLDADLKPLLASDPKLVVHGIAVDGLRARLVQEGDKASWMPPQYEGDVVPPVPIPPPADEAPPADAWVVHAIDVRNSTIDYTKNGEAYTIDIVKLAIADIGPDHPVPIDSKFVVTQGTVATRIEAAGKVTFDPRFTRWSLADVAISGESPLIGGRFGAKLDADVDVTGETFTLSRSQIEMGGVTGTLTANGKSVLTEPVITGSIDLPQQNLAAVAATYQVAIDEPLGVRGNFTASEDAIAIADAEFKYGTTTATGDVGVRVGKPSRATFDLVVDRFEIPSDEPAKVALGGGPFPLAMFAAPIATVDPSLDEPLIPTDVLAEYDWAGSTKVGTLVYEGVEFPDASIRTTKKNGVIDADVSLPSFFGGRADAKVSVDARTGEPLWKIAPKLADVDSKQLLAFLDQRLDWTALLLAGSELTMRGNTPRELIGSLKGHTTFDGGKGKLNIAELKHQVQTIALVAGKDDRVAKWPDVLDYQKMKGTWDVDGTQHDVAFDLDNLTMVAKGTYDPLAQDMDMRVAVTVKSNVEPKPFQIDPLFMDVALPLRCRGSTEEPKCSADQDGVKKLIASALSGQGNPEMQKKLGKAIDEKVPEQYREAARDLLKMLGQPAPKEESAPQSAPAP